MFRHRQQVRRWAARALAVWLFGVAAGIAQACLAPNLDGQRAVQTDPFNVLKHGEAAQPAGDLHHAAKQTQHGGASGHDDSLVDSICQDFCEKAAIAVPPLKSALDKTQGDTLPPVAGATACPAPATEPLPLSVPRRHGALAPPIRLAFLRLAL